VTSSWFFLSTHKMNSWQGTETRHVQHSVEHLPTKRFKAYSRLSGVTERGVARVIQNIYYVKQIFILYP